MTQSLPNESVDNSYTYHVHGWGKINDIIFNEEVTKFLKSTSTTYSYIYSKNNRVKLIPCLNIKFNSVSEYIQFKMLFDIYNG